MAYARQVALSVGKLVVAEIFQMLGARLHLGQLYDLSSGVGFIFFLAQKLLVLLYFGVNTIKDYPSASVALFHPDLVSNLSQQKK